MCFLNTADINVSLMKEVMPFSFLLVIHVYPFCVPLH